MSEMVLSTPEHLAFINEIISRANAEDEVHETGVVTGLLIAAVVNRLVAQHPDHEPKWYIEQIAGSAAITLAGVLAPAPKVN